LPTRTMFEIGTSFVNQEGRLQFASAAHRGGIPISQISSGDHPPRVFRRDIPGGEPEPAWQLLARLGNAISLPEKQMLPLSRSDLWIWITTAYPALAGLQFLAERPMGVRVDLGQHEEDRFSSCVRIEPEKREYDSHLDILLVDWTFGTEELSSYSTYIEQVEKKPYLLMQTKDASAMGLKDKERCTLHLDGGLLELELQVIENMATGVIVLPRHRKLAWQKLKEGMTRIPRDRIRKK
jgi:NADH-quinone oxidoreductase subunit G